MIGGRNIRRNLLMPLRMVGFVIPLFMVSFGAVVQFFTPGVDELQLIKFLGLSLAWVSLGAVQLLKSQYPRTVLILYHLLAFLSILMMYSVMAPFIPFWTLLTLASYVRFGGTGMVLSLVWLGFTLSVSTALSYNQDPSIFAYEFSSLIAVATASYVILVLSSSQEKARKMLQTSKNRESLQRNRLLSIINNQSDGIISIDANGIVRLFNAASMWLLDTNKDLIGQKINSVFPLLDLDKKPINTLKVTTSYSTNTIRDDLLYKTNEGEFLRLEVTFAPIKHAYGKRQKNQDIDGYVLIFRDVTKEKSLDDEKNEFISVVSHELRTPITVAEGALSNATVLFDSPKAPKAAVRNSIKMAHNQVLFLAHLINDLSTLSRAQRDAMSDPEVISIKELGYQSIDRYAFSAKEKGLTLDLDLSPKLGSVYTSRLYLEELLQNLIQNAIKYTKKGGVTLKIERKNDDVIFRVIDTGIGISKSEREKIFQKFYRSEDFRTRETDGTGLGLFLSAQLADKMGAWLEVSSRLNHGSTFSFKLPSHKET